MATDQLVPTGQGPTTTRRRLRAELRGLRLAQRLSIEQVTNEVEWSTSKLIRIENGQVGVAVSDLMALLAIYGVSAADRVNELKELARSSRQRTWWSKYQRHISAGYSEFIGAEADAAVISHYHPTIMPGLLQVERYADALIRGILGPETPAEQVETAVEVRMMRKRHVLDRPGAPEFLVMVDEAALRRPIGGRAVMREQLDHIIALAERPSVSVMVVPLSTGAHPGLDGAFAVMEYEDEDQLPPVVFLESAQGNLVLRDNSGVIDRYRDAVARLRDVGLHGSDAVQFIAEINKSFGSTGAQ